MTTQMKLHLHNETKSRNLYLVVYQRPPSGDRQGLHSIAWAVQPLGPGQSANPVIYRFAYQLWVAESTEVGDAARRTTLVDAAPGERWKFVQLEPPFTALQRADEPATSQAHIELVNETPMQIDVALAIDGRPLLIQERLNVQEIVAITPNHEICVAATGEIHAGDPLPAEAVKSPGVVIDFMAVPGPVDRDVRVGDAPDEADGLSWRVAPHIH
jgi:hypothetical protein